jgi:hypothetical protein
LRIFFLDLEVFFLGTAMTLNTFGLYRQTNILADFARNAYSKNGNNCSASNIK